MRLVGLALCVGGWAIAVSGLFLSSSAFGRGAFACAGIVVSLAGSVGVINSYYLARANWKQ